MMAQNLTRFTLTMVVLGALLALAVFEPEIFPILSPGPEEVEETPQAELELARQETALNEREEALNQRETTLTVREEALDQREAALDAREEALNRLQVFLERQSEALRVVDPPPSTPQVQGAGLVDGQRLEGCLRLTIAAAAVSSLMAGFSVLALVTVGRKCSGQSSNGASRPQESRARSEERVHYGRGVVRTAKQSPNKGNGRTRTA